jgi:hypothetical protein
MVLPARFISTSLSKISETNFGAHLEVLQHRHLGKDDAALRHVGQAAVEHLIRPEPGDVLTVEAHPAAGRPEEAHDGLEGGRLAGAVGADHAHHLSRAHLDRHVVEDRHLAVARGDALGAQQHGTRLRPHGRRRAI